MTWNKIIRNIMSGSTNQIYWIIYIYIYIGHTQKNGAVLILNTIKTAPLFCVHPVYIYTVTEELTSRGRVHLEKLVVLQVVYKFNIFYVNRNSIRVLQTCSHFRLLWTTCIQSIPYHPLPWRHVLILYRSEIVSASINSTLHNVKPPAAVCTASGQHRSELCVL
jgi:hypothetical protein